MYFVPEGTEFCGFYECENDECSMRFLSTRIVPRMMCPYCGEEVDMEIGPDDEMPQNTETAKLLHVVEGKEEVEMTDSLLSVAFDNSDIAWM